MLQRTGDAGIQLLLENHWGPSLIPDNIVKLLKALPKLGLLLDSFNWKYCYQTEGWLKCAKYAKSTHLKSFAFTKDGQDLTQNLPAFVHLLQSVGYQGTWGVESVPLDGKEIEAACKTIALIKRSVKRR